MATRKTMATDENVRTHLAGVPERRRLDGERLIEIMSSITGEPARMWGSSIIGFGEYTQTYADGRTDTMLVTGFAPRKQHLVLYIMGGLDAHAAELARLGKHRTGKACLYLNKLADVDEAVLRTIIRNGVKKMAPKRVRSKLAGKAGQDARARPGAGS